VASRRNGCSARILAVTHLALSCEPNRRSGWLVDGRSAESLYAPWSARACGFAIRTSKVIGLRELPGNGSANTPLPGWPRAGIAGRGHGSVPFMRKQYHLWPADTGFDAWDIDRLISLSRELPVHVVAVDSVREVDTVYWFDGSTGRPPSARSWSTPG
jgi:hypothetical protein